MELELPGLLLVVPPLLKGREGREDQNFRYVNYEVWLLNNFQEGDEGSRRVFNGLDDPLAALRVPLQFYLRLRFPFEAEVGVALEVPYCESFFIMLIAFEYPLVIARTASVHYDDASARHLRGSTVQ